MLRTALRLRDALLVTVPLSLVLASVTAAPVAGVARPQQDAQVTRLQQELDTLKYRLDYEVQQLQRTVEQLQSRLLAVDERQRAALPPSSSPIAPSPPSATSAGADISASRFVIEDPQGRVRGVATVGDRFGPMLALLDEAGEVRLLLSAPGEGPRLELFDGALRLRLSARVDGDMPVLELLDDEGNAVARLRVESGQGVLDLHEDRR